MRWSREAKHNGGKPLTEDRVEEEFWDLVETGTREAVVCAHVPGEGGGWVGGQPAGTHCISWPRWLH